MKIRITSSLFKIILGLFIILYVFNQYTLTYNQTKLDFGKETIATSQWTLVGAPILIDDLDPNFNWSRTAQENEWCYGSGTWSDPYIIENVTIDGVYNGNCLEVRNSNKSFIIRNCITLHSGGVGLDAGIKLDNTSNGLIFNCKSIDNLNQALLVNECQNISITNTRVNNNTYGIRFRYTNNSAISNCVSTDNEQQGISIIHSYNNLVSRNNIENTDDLAIFLYFCQNNTITENTIINNQFGIYIWDANKNFIYRNYLSKNDFPQADEGTSNFNHWNNSFIGNYWEDYIGTDSNSDGIGESPVFINAFSTDYHPIYGDPFHYGESIHIDGLGLVARNWFWASTRAWCYGSGTESDPYIIENLFMNGFGDGPCLLIENSDVYFKVYNCSLFNSGGEQYDAGIKLSNVEHGILLGNNCSYNFGAGIYIDKDCSNLTINDNILKYNNKEMGGIFIEGMNTTLQNNKLFGCGIKLAPSLERILSYNIGLSNLVNNRNFYYYINELALRGSDFLNAGQIILFNCNNSFIKKLNFIEGSSAVSLYFCKNVTISDNKIAKNAYGIFSHMSFFNNFSNNNIEENNIGILLVESNNNSVLNNEFRSNSIGLVLNVSNYNLIKFNNFKLNGHNILELNSSMNIIENNTYYSGSGGNDFVFVLIILISIVLCVMISSLIVLKKRKLTKKPVSKELIVLNIKKAIINYGLTGGRVSLRKITRKCKAEEGEVITIIKEMINSGEIDAEYFGVSRSLVFNRKTISRDIDRLMKSFTEWEKEKKDTTPK